MTDSNESPPEQDAPDVSGLVAYMQRKRLARMEVTLEAVPKDERPQSSVIVADRGSMTDNSIPSNLGLDGGVFIVVTV